MGAPRSKFQPQTNIIPGNNLIFLSKFVGNKAKRRISKRVFQENKSTPNFPKKQTFLTP